MFNTYIAFLRGINVSGQKTIKMLDLISLCEKLQYKNLSTYLQSGNIIFQTTLKNPSKIAINIQEAIYHQYHFLVPTFIFTPASLSKILQENPLKDHPSSNLYLTFLQNHNMTLFTQISPEFFLPDIFLQNQKTIYLFCQNGYGKTKLSNAFFENKLNTIATTRNFNTCQAVLNIALTKI